MSRERWQRIESVFHDAVSLPPSERDRFLTSACAGDGGLRREVECLLAMMNLSTTHWSEPSSRYSSSFRRDPRKAIT